MGLISSPSLHLLGGIIVFSTVLVIVGGKRAIAELTRDVTIDLSAMTSLGEVGVFSAGMPFYWGILLYLAAPTIAGEIRGPKTDQ